MNMFKRPCSVPLRYKHCSNLPFFVILVVFLLLTYGVFCTKIFCRYSDQFFCYSVSCTNVVGKWQVTLLSVKHTAEELGTKMSKITGKPPSDHPMSLPWGWVLLKVAPQCPTPNKTWISDSCFIVPYPKKTWGSLTVALQNPLPPINLKISESCFAEPFPKKLEDVW